MLKLKYQVQLSTEERELLLDIVSKGNLQPKKIKRANVLLSLGEHKEIHLKDEKEIAKRFNLDPITIYLIRKTYATQGIHAAIERKKRKDHPVRTRITKEIEDKIIEMYYSEPPKGYSKWTTRLLAEKLVKMNYIKHISHTTVWMFLKNRISQKCNYKTFPK